MSDDFRELLAALVDLNARFLVVGAHALAAHGVSRMTGDLDLWVEPTEHNAVRIWDALTRFGAPIGNLGLQRSDFVHLEQVIQLGLPPDRIDLMASISGVDFAEAWSAGGSRGSRVARMRIARRTASPLGFTGLGVLS